MGYEAAVLLALSVSLALLFEWISEELMGGEVLSRFQASSAVKATLLQ